VEEIGNVVVIYRGGTFVECLLGIEESCEMVDKDIDMDS
jgi:hypothetical protein